MGLYYMMSEEEMNFGKRTLSKKDKLYNPNKPYKGNILNKIKIFKK